MVVTLSLQAWAASAPLSKTATRPCPPALVDSAQAVAQLRSVAGGLNPTCRVISPSQLRAELDRKLRRDLPLPPEEYLRVLIRLGFVSGEPRTMYQRLLDFYSGQVLGFYEPASDEMVLVDSPANRAAQASLLWAHELTHAAQQKRFALPSHLLAMRDNSDRQRAASAIAEGDAMLTMLLLAAPEGAESTALAAAERMATGSGLPVPAAPGVPNFFVADLLFPYTQGLAAVLAAYRRGGWTAVDQLLAAPPESSAALRNPHRRVSPVSDGELPPTPDGFREVLTDTVGEWALQFWLSQVLPNEEAARLADLWRGDRLRIIEHVSNSDRWGLTWVIRTGSVATRRELERVLQSAAPRLLSLGACRKNAPAAARAAIRPAALAFARCPRLARFQLRLRASCSAALQTGAIATGAFVGFSDRLLAHEGAIPPAMVWISTGATLEMRVHWPAPPNQQPPRNRVTAPVPPP